MKEQCSRFGPNQRLAGIITEPAGAPRAVTIWVSAGLLPKHGPFRLYTEASRRLVRVGVASLRFDLSGVGDSPNDSSGRPLAERTALEIAAAIEHVAERFGNVPIALAGLCSGAEDAFRAAASDSRVQQVVMIDPFAYRTSGWAARHALYRVGRRLLRAAGLYRPSPSPQSRAVSYRYLEREESEPLLRQLLEREVRVHFIYTAGMRERFNHRSQLGKQFPGVDFRGLVTLDYLPQVDHTQLLASDRELMVETIARRIQAGPQLSAEALL